MPKYKGVQMTGDVNRFKKLFDSPSSVNKLWTDIKIKGLKRVLLFYEEKIKKNIYSSGTLAGAPFQPNSLMTVMAKGSSKPLINNGDLMGGVHPVVVNENVGFVGLKRGTSGEGGDLADIAEESEYGGVTSDGKIIPARPFIYPVKKKFKKEAQSVLVKTIEKELN